jgi:hypothetical protein
MAAVYKFSRFFSTAKQLQLGAAKWKWLPVGELFKELEAASGKCS